MPRIIKCTLQIENTDISTHVHIYVNKCLVCKQNGGLLTMEITGPTFKKILLDLILNLFLLSL